MAPTRICVILCALISLSSSTFANFSERRCRFEHFSDNDAADEPPREIDWKQRFIDNELSKGETLENIYSSPVYARELQIKVERNVSDLYLSAKKSLRCAIIDADKVIASTIESTYISDLFVKGTQELRELKIKTTNVHRLKLYSNFTYDSKIFGVSIDANTVEGITAQTSNFSQNLINSFYLTDVRVEALNIEHNIFKARSGGAYNVAMCGTYIINDTLVEALDIDKMHFKAPEINNTNIDGTYLSAIALEAHILNNTYIAGESLKNIFIVGASTLDNVTIKAQTLENVRLAGGFSLGEVNIVASGIDDLFIEGYPTGSNNVTINSSPVLRQEGFLRMQCADRLGYPIDEDLGSAKKCMKKYCQLMCGAINYQNSQCLGRTCCCLQ